jgi:hypothetical protein
MGIQIQFLEFRLLLSLLRVSVAPYLQFVTTNCLINEKNFSHKIGFLKKSKEFH